MYPFPNSKACSRLKLGSEDFTSIPTLTLVNLKEKRGGGEQLFVYLVMAWYEGNTDKQYG